MEVTRQPKELNTKEEQILPEKDGMQKLFCHWPGMGKPGNTKVALISYNF